MRKKDVEKVLDEIISFADIGEFINQPIKHYSTGMFARLAFAVAINIEPEILIVDEILSVGDVSFQKKCFEKFDEFVKNGKTILYVSHNLDTIKKYCTKAIWLEKGRIAGIGEPDKIIEEYYRSLSNDENVSNDDKGRFMTSEGEFSSDKKFVKLKELLAYNSSNEIVDSINSGDTMQLRIKYNVLKTDIYRPGIYIELRYAGREPMEIGEIDRFLFAFNSNVDGVRIPWEEGENSVTVNIETLKLGKGRYYFDVVFLESQNLVSIETVNNAFSFNVISAPEGEGYVFLNTEWKNSLD